MKIRATVAAILVVIGIGIVCVCRQTQTRKPSAGVPSAPAVATQDAAAVAPRAATVTSPAATALTLSATNQTPTVRGTRPYVLVSAGFVNKAFLSAVERLGAKTVAHLDAKRVLVEADEASVRRLSADARIDSLSERLPSAKVDATLAKRIADGAKTVETTVVALSEADREGLMARVAAAGGELLAGCLTSANSFVARLPTESVVALAARGEVQWLEAFERPRFQNDLAVNEKMMNILPIWKSATNSDGLSGAGQIVSTSDSGIDTGDLSTMHADLKQQVVGIKVVDGCYDYDADGHGTHTAGSIVGDGTKSGGQIRGSAWGAKLYAWFCGGKDGYVYTPSSVADLFRPDQSTHPAYIHSASWGSDRAGAYTDECRNIDQYIWQNPDFLPVFSAGNEGRYGACTIGSPASSKNVLAVGATQSERSGHDRGWGNGNPEATALFSSRGPCKDGRIKPDVATPGVGILSTRANGIDYSYGNYNDFYAYDSGTSMACPLTAGAVALVREWLLRRDEFSDEAEKRPTAALMKAVIMGGAKGVTKPDNNQGWGRVDIRETLYPEDCAVKLVDRIPFSDGTNLIWVVETTNAAPLDVQLVWVDYPGSPSGTQTLVNDLDLTVEAILDGGVSVWYGNGGASADRKNNAESVRIESAVPSRYVISVDGTRIAHDYTEGGAAALYIRGAFDPAAEPPAPRLVQIKERDLGYRSLVRALAEVADGETVEILAPVTLDKPVTLDVNCTITATNANVDACAVNCLDKTGLTVSAGKRVLFTNVALTNAASVTVAAGGTVALSGAVELGSVTASDATGIELAGEISRNVVVRSPNMQVGEPFGKWTCDFAKASACAMLFENASDDELGGTVQADSNDLIWGAAVVPDAAAAVRLTGDGTSRNFRSLRTLFKYVTNDAEIAVLKDCVLSAPAPVTNAIALVGGSPSLKLTVEKDGGFVVVDGKLSVSNLTLTGETTAALFSVGDYKARRDGELCLGEGVTVREIVGNANGAHGGVVCLWRGRVTLCEGAQILDCVSAGDGGGGIYAYGKDSTVALEGGLIARCSAVKWGGGVCAEGSSQVEISGGTVVKGNRIQQGREDDIYSCKKLRVVGPVTSGAKAIGVEVDGATGSGDAFATYDGLALDDPAKSAAAFFNTVNADVGPLADSAAETFVWDPAAVDRTTDEDHANVRVVYPDATTNYYVALDIAFSDLKGDCRVELMHGIHDLDGDLEVNNSVILTTDPSLDECTLLDRIRGTITVRAGATLTLTNLCVSGCYVDGWDWTVNDDKRLIFVDGGSLVLEKDGGISEFDGNGSRDASAVVVYRGSFTMKDGSYVKGCWNNYVDTLKDVDTGTGGGVLLDGGSTANLLGGEIRNCCATYGGGLALCNKSTAYVSGNVLVTGNTDLEGNRNDLLVEDLSTLVLSAPLGEGAAIGRVIGYQADTNLAAVVTDWTNRWTADELAKDAAKFFSNDFSGARGVAVTNGSSSALVVWSGSVAREDRSYVAPDGETYYVVGELPDPEPKYATPEPIAFTSIVRGATSVTLAFTNAVRWCNYRVFATDTLEGGFVLTNATGEVIVDDITNFQWKAENGPVEMTFPATDDQRFWKVMAFPGEIPSEAD